MNSDGFHFNGTCYNVYGYGLNGYPENDDMFGICAYDGSAAPPDTPTFQNGSQSYFYFDRTSTTYGGGTTGTSGTQSRVRYLAFSNNPISNITFSNSKGLGQYTGDIANGNGTNQVISGLKFINNDFSTMVDGAGASAFYFFANFNDVLFDNPVFNRLPAQSTTAANSDYLIRGNAGTYKGGSVTVRNGSMTNVALIAINFSIVGSVNVNGGAFSTGTNVQSSFFFSDQGAVCTNFIITGGASITGYNRTYENDNAGGLTNFIVGNSTISNTIGLAYFANATIQTNIFTGNIFGPMPYIFYPAGSQTANINVTSSGNVYRYTTAYMNGPGSYTNRFNGIDLPISIANLTPLSNDVVIDPTNGYSRYNGSAWTNR